MSREQALRHIALAQRAFEQGAFGTAEANFRCAVQLFPEDPEARFGLALALSSGDKHSESLKEIQQALQLQPGNTTGWILLSSLLQRLGRFDEAVEASLSAARMSPNLSKPFVDIVSCRKVRSDDTLLMETLNSMANDGDRPLGELVSVEYALGKGYSDLREFERAMVHFDAANCLGAQVMDPKRFYNPAAEENAAAGVIDRFTKLSTESYAEAGSDSELPVFIVGMIRSGTTLLDAMLACHPLIGSAGELRFWEDRASILLPKAYQGTLHPHEIRLAADEFRRLLRSASFASKRVIDKMPVNYQHVGLIRMAFPNARFIHCQRHPVDTCLSIYCTDFGPEPPRFAFSKPNIVHAYRTYLRFMDHWHSVLPEDRLIDVSYADLVLDREATLAKVIQFLGLEWSEEVLRHENSTAPIQTPSRWQARQPVYTSSLDRWMQVEPWLGEFRELL